MTNHAPVYLNRQEIDRPFVRLFRQRTRQSLGFDGEARLLRRLREALLARPFRRHSPTMSTSTLTPILKGNASTSIMFAPKTKPNTPKSSSRPNRIYRSASSDWISLFTFPAAATLINYQTIPNNAPPDAFSNALLHPLHPTLSLTRSLSCSRSRFSLEVLLQIIRINNTIHVTRNV